MTLAQFSRTRAGKAVDMPPAQIKEFTNSMDERGRVATANQLDMLLGNVAWRYGYINARGNGEPHTDAVSEANRMLTAMRDAMGYSYPKSGEIHV